MTKLETEIKEYYKELYNAFDNSELKDWFKKESCHFTAMKGKYYDKQTIKLLLVGIATNGWGPLNTQNSEAFATAALNKIINEPIGDNMKIHMKESPFWDYSRGVMEQLTGKTINTQNDMVANYIAWSNLYKIAPNNPKESRSNNPTKEQQAIQRELSKKILQTEISLLEPTHILFITEKRTKKEEERTWWTWIEPFIKGKTKKEQEKMNGFLNINNIPDDYIRGKSLYCDSYIHNVKIVIATRPETAKRDKWIKDVVSAFNSL